METEHESDSWDRLPFKLDEACWGKLKRAIEECPGVYYVSTTADGIFSREFYVVTQTGTPSVISSEVAARGIETGGVRIFEYEDIDSAYHLVAYEIMRYRVKNGLPMAEGEGSLYGAAVYRTEYFPWYFGETIPPRSTPFGLTLRVKKAGEGLFFLETDQCRWVLAVSFPIWDSELSEYAKRLGVKGGRLSKHEEATRYLFFTEKRCAPAVYELLAYSRHQGLAPFIRSRQVLENYLWEHFLAYTLVHNAIEVSGFGRADTLENCLNSLGLQVPKIFKDRERRNTQRIERCIIYSEGLAGQELLLLP